MTLVDVVSVFVGLYVTGFLSGVGLGLLVRVISFFLH